MLSFTLETSRYPRLPTILIPVDVYIRVPHNSGMRYLLLALAIIPSASADSHNRLYFAPRLVETLLPIPEIRIEDPRQIKCLATMIYGEARGEAKEGKVAVAYTAMNRAVKRPVCAVVLAPKQYSIFNNNPALRAAALSPNLEPHQKNIIDNQSWKDSLKVAKLVMRGLVADPTNGSTHYLAPIAMKQLGYKYPKWSYQYIKTAVIDNHVFFKPHYPK